jgi:hypothetical protein
MKNKEILNLIHIYVFGRTMHLIMYMMRPRHKNLYTRIQLNKLFYQFLKDIIQLYWHMVRLEQVKHIRWKVLSTVQEILKEV